MKLRYAAIVVAVAGFTMAPSAGAQLISQPTPAYVAGTFKLTSGAPAFTVIGGLTDGTRSVTFSSNVMVFHAPLPDEWKTWNTSPFVEPTPTEVYEPDDDLLTSIAMSVGSGVGIFGFEAEPDNPSVEPLTATWYDALNNVLASETLNVDGAGGALLFAYESDANNIDHVSFGNGVSDDFAIGNIRVGDVTPSPEPASLVLVGTGLLGVAGIARRFRRRAA